MSCKCVLCPECGRYFKKCECTPVYLPPVSCDRCKKEDEAYQRFLDRAGQKKKETS